MTEVQVVYWRDIPAQVKARDGSTRAGRVLGTRFQEAIDAAAMRAGLTGTDAYLAEWRSGEWTEASGPPEEAAEARAAALEAAFDADHLLRLVDSGGREA